MIRALTALLLTAVAAVACQSPNSSSSRPDIIIASDLPTSAFDSALPFEHAIDFAIRRQSTIEGYSRIQESDMIAVPDAATFQLIPWTTEQPVARMFCDVQVPGGPLGSARGGAAAPESAARRAGSAPSASRDGAASPATTP